MCEKVRNVNCFAEIYIKFRKEKVIMVLIQPITYQIMAKRQTKYEKNMAFD